MSKGQELDDPSWGYGIAVLASGLGDRQLRAGLDRGVLSVGTKLKVGRWAFSDRDIFQLIIIGTLTNDAYLPISQANVIANIIKVDLEYLIEAGLREAVHGEQLPKVPNICVFPGDVPYFFYEMDGERWTNDLPGFEVLVDEWPKPYVVLSSGYVMSRLELAIGRSSIDAGIEEAPQ